LRRLARRAGESRRQWLEEAAMRLESTEQTMRLESEAFADHATIPRRFTCDGEDVSPPLRWTGAPEETKSFVLLCNDPDAPAGTWRHWAAYDIPPGQTSFAEGEARAVRRDFKQATNDFRKSGYGGPCPPHGHGTHHYHFCLLALDCDALPLRAKQPDCEEVEREARKHALAEATLVGVYKR
jgi:hypothetical protein